MIHSYTADQRVTAFGSVNQRPILVDCGLAFAEIGLVFPATLFPFFRKQSFLCHNELRIGIYVLCFLKAKERASVGQAGFYKQRRKDLRIRRIEEF